MKIHILGIAGTFMSGIAILAKQKGHEVSGSDNVCYDPIRSILEKEKIIVKLGYKNKDLINKDLIIIGNIMSRGTPIIEYIMKNNIPYTSGPKWLNQNILKNKKVLVSNFLSSDCIALDVNEDGSLNLLVDNFKQKVTSGEVSLKIQK